MRRRAGVVIIGAGIVGCGVAEHLTRMGWRDDLARAWARLPDQSVEDDDQPRELRRRALFGAGTRRQAVLPPGR